MNKFAKESNLIIFSDGPKHGSENKVESLRNYLNNIDGFKSISVVKRTENMGLANSIISGVSEIVNRYGRVIVLEDDLITSPNFLEYMNDALALYESCEEVISIHGYIYPVKQNLPHTFFLKGADCWGWATWKHGWDLFEEDGSLLLQQLQDQKLTKEFDFNGSYPYTKMLKDQIAGKNNSWAIRWYASAFLKNMLTLYPAKSFVKNIGIDGSGTHCSASNDYDAELVNTYRSLSHIPVKENKVAKRNIENYFRSLKKRYILRIIARVRTILVKRLRKY